MRLEKREISFQAIWKIHGYSQISGDYNLNPSQKLQYLYNLLHSDAKRYYLDKVDGYGTSFQQAVSMPEEEYNSPVRRTRVKKYLNLLRVSSFISQGMETSVAHSKIYKSVVV